VSLKEAQDTVLAVCEWLRIAYMVFLSSEGKTLMGIRDYGAWKEYSARRFVGILHLTVMNADRTNSPIPTWAKSMIQIGWNIEGLASERSEVESRAQEPAETPEPTIDPSSL
jgi:hypothetical protein